MNPTEQAENLLEEVGMNQLPIISQDICKRLSINYVEKSFEGFEGTLVASQGGSIVLIGVNSDIRELGRKNYTCAHELGHYCMDLLDAQKFECSKNDIDSYSHAGRAMEVRANRFAADLLMPRKIFTRLMEDMDPEWTSIKDLAGKSHTSLLATARRFMDLTDQSCALILSENDGVSWFHKSKSFAPYVQCQVKKLSPKTFAHAAFLGKSLPNDFETVKADNWLSGRGLDSEAEVLEWTLPVNSYGQVFTLLWDDQGLSGWDGEDEDKVSNGDDEASTEWEPPTFHRSRRKA